MSETVTRVDERATARGRTIFSRSLREERRGLLGWTLGIIAYCLVLLSVFPTVHGNAEFAKIFELYPETFRKLFMVQDYTTGPGFLRAEVFSFVVPLLLALFAVLWGADLIAGEEERRTIDILLATPVSRHRVVVEKWGALVVDSAIVALAVEATIGVAGPLFKLHVGWNALSAAVTGSWLFALAFGTLALALGAATGRRGLARGVTTGVALASYLVSALAPLVSWLQPVKNLSLWQHTLGSDPLTTGFVAWRLGVVVAVTLILLGGALWGFERRDLAT